MKILITRKTLQLCMVTDVTRFTVVITAQYIKILNLVVAYLKLVIILLFFFKVQYRSKDLSTWKVYGSGSGSKLKTTFKKHHLLHFGVIIKNSYNYLRKTLKNSSPSLLCMRPDFLQTNKCRAERMKKQMRLVLTP